MGMITYQTLRQLRRHRHQLVLEVIDHNLHAVVQDIEVGLLGELQQVLDDFADLRRDLLADDLVRLDELGDTEGGLHANGELGVVKSGKDSMEVLPEMFLVRPLQARLGEGAEDLEGLSNR